VPTRRAVVLVLAQKADSVHDTGLVLRAEHLALAVPSVVRLRQFVHTPHRRRVALSRRAVMARDGHRCQYCGAHADSIDHVLPRSRGGAHSWENCVACCARCNTRKADRLLEEIGWSLPFRPSPPVRTGSGRVWLADDTDPAWEPWLPTAA
jgi:5-methylcytosine-specific restriction endonuclease McrA